MKKRLAKRAAALFLAAGILCGGVSAAESSCQTLYENRSVLAEGFDYISAIHRTPSLRRVESHSVSIAPDSGVYPIALACDTVYGGLTISAMISYAESLGYTVLGAVNSDFGYSSTRIPCGMAVENGVYKTSSDGSNALAFTSGGAFVSIDPKVEIRLTGDESGESTVTTRLNKSRDESGLFLYTEHFSTVSTRTSGEGWAVRFEVLEGEMSVQGGMKLRVSEIYQGDKPQYIGEGNIILTAAESAGLESELAKFSVGDLVTLETRCSDPRLAEAEWICGCGDLLAENGDVRGGPESWDQSIKGSHPRTLAGIKGDGTLVFTAIDGRSAESAGATLLQAAEMLLAEGCETVVNLDGGGSTAIALRSPQSGEFTVLNRPSDGSLRPCAGYILFVTDESAGSSPRLFCSGDGAFVLAGSGIDLEFFAADAALTPLELSSGVVLTSGFGSFDGVRYVPDPDAGTHEITFSAGGVSGSAVIHAVESADELIASHKESGKTLDSLRLYCGESAALSVSARILLRDVFMDGSAVSFSCGDEIGSISPDGVFTAGSVPGAEGSIIIEAAGLSLEIPVSIKKEFTDLSGHWAEEEVIALYDAGIVNGTSLSTFSPDLSMKRGDFILMLYRACGSPAVSGSPEYSDVPADSYYAPAITWAGSMGIALGSGDGRFMPEDTLSRQQAFTFVYRSLELLGLSAPKADGEALAAFSDAGSVADYAVDAASALVSMGIINGSGGKLDPTGSLTRAQMAKILHTCLEK